ncbi:MAG: outer membrane beta-barrel family protein [Muribaculaceae bacterium]
MRHLLTLPLIIIFACSNMAQAVNYIYGEIGNDDKVGTYTVSISNGNDTIIGTFYDMAFSLPVDTVGSYNIRIKSQGYADLTTSIDVKTSTYDLGVLYLQEQRSIELKEVVVEAKKCVVKREGTSYEISNIVGTYLGDAGSIKDMLVLTPGLMQDGNGGVKLLNETSPDIYINERKVTESELLMLRSNDVAKIEVIRDPGARYKSSTQSVVKITLRKRIKDYIGLNVSEEIIVGRKISNESNINISTKTGKLSTLVSFHYELSNKHLWSEQNTAIAKTANYNSINDYITDSLTNHRDGYYTLAGLTYNFNNNSYLSMQYNGAYTRSNRNQNIYHTFLEDNATTLYRELSDTPKDNNNRHNATMSYFVKRNALSSLNLGLNYSRIANNSDKNVFIEQTGTISEESDSHSAINSKSQYDLLNFEANYTFAINKINKFGIGISSDYISNNYTYIQSQSEQDSKRKDFIHGVYATYNVPIKKFTLFTQLRYEYNHSTLNTPTSKESVSYHTVLPFVRLLYMINNNDFIQIAYRSFSNRPSISQLSNIISYSDMLHSSVGNPSLKSENYNNIWLTYGVGKFNATLYYRYGKDAIVNGTFMQSDSRNILIKPINSNYRSQWSLDCDYSISKPKYSLNFSVIESYTTVKYPVIENIANSSLYNWHTSVSVSGRWNFYKTLEFHGSASYNSSFLDGNQETGDMWELTLGIKGRFVKNRLIASIKCSDILRRGVTPYCESKFANVSEWRRNHFDTRNISFSIQYLFNVVRSNFKNSNVGSDAKSRAK